MIVAPFGSWKSPVTTDMIVADSLGLGQVVVDGCDIYWSETRPVEGGRNVIVRWRNGELKDVLPAPYSARSRVHEYGGGSYTVADGVLYFCNDVDQHLYRVVEDASPVPITIEERCRYADVVVDRARRRLIAICEDHSGSKIGNSIVSIDIDGAHVPRTLVAGSDFYAVPRVSNDGHKLTWISWNHPDMPWDGTELRLADIDADGAVANARRVAGGHDESILQPSFGPDGLLYFVSDRSNWWNLYRLHNGEIEALAPMQAETAWPHWVFGESAYAFASAEEIVLACNRRGIWSLRSLMLGTGTLRELSSPYCDIHTLVAANGHIAFVGASTSEPPAVVRYDIKTSRVDTLRRSTATVPDAGYLATPNPIEFVTADGSVAHAFFYPPTNRDYVAPPNERPPLLVLSHGGPTAAASPAINLKLQYWTSRGFAVLDLNYRGSTGFGRAYRHALYGQWGVADVEDAIHGARFLLKNNRVDQERMAIRGGSAGGYTTLCALTFHAFFHAGAVYYGVSDLEALAKETHKFEQHYTDQLVGPYPAQRELYVARSPIRHVSRLSCPLIFFQGLEDKVVPPDQTAMMVQALRAKRIPVACIEFAGEAHGFRRAENIKRSLEAELYFYSRIFGFVPADAIEPVTIENFSVSN